MIEKNIDFFTDNQSVLEFFPPVPAIKIVPDWYKKLPKSQKIQSESNVPTIKMCVPVRDYITSGYAILNPYEIHIECTEEGFLTNCPIDDKKIFAMHPHEQFPILLNGKKFSYLKIFNPWLIKTPPGYSIHIYPPFYNFNSNFTILPGIVDTDKHEDAINFVGIPLKKEFTISAGEPIAIVYPFKRNDWKMSVKYKNFTKDTPFSFFSNNVWHGLYQRMFHTFKKFK